MIPKTNFDGECIQAIARDALASREIYPIAAAVATNLGLKGRTEGDYVSKQAGFQTADGVFHSLAFDSQNWTQAVMIKRDPRDQTTVLLVVGRDGALLRAGHMAGNVVVVWGASKQSHAQAVFSTEAELWRAAGPDRFCGPS